MPTLNNVHKSQAFFRPLLALSLGGIVSAALVAAAADRMTGAPPPALRVHRTWMPKAYPSAFAIGFPSGLNFCFDPVRAKVIYAWEGDFIDLSPTVDGKIPHNAVIQGEMFFQAVSPSPFKIGKRTTEPSIRFTGHRVVKEVPEFRYEVDGIAVRESVRPAAGRKALVSQFTLSTPDEAMTYLPAQPELVSIDSGPAKWVDGRLYIPGNSSVVFSVTRPAP